MTDPARIGELYRATREELSALALGLTEQQRATKLPATPDWTARDVVAHVTGIVTDILAGNLGGVGTDAWTEAQIAAREGRTIEEIVAEWAEHAPTVEAMAASTPAEMTLPLLSDLCTHTFDVRGAFADAGGRNTETVAVVFDVYVTGLGQRLDDAGAPALIIHTLEGDQVHAGHGGPGARVRGERFDLVRAMTGRRSADQIRSFIWDGSSAPYIEPFAQYPMRDEPLIERYDEAEAH